MTTPENFELPCLIDPSMNCSSECTIYFAALRIYRQTAEAKNVPLDLFAAATRVEFKNMDAFAQDAEIDRRMDDIVAKGGLPENCKNFYFI